MFDKSHVWFSDAPLQFMYGLWANLPLIVVHDELWARYLWSWTKLSLSLSRSLWFTLALSLALFRSFWLPLALSGAHRLTRSLIGSTRCGNVATVYPALVSASHKAATIETTKKQTQLSNCPWWRSAGNCWAAEELTRLVSSTVLLLPWSYKYNAAKSSEVYTQLLELCTSFRKQVTSLGFTWSWKLNYSHGWNLQKLND